ncbi:flagellar hook-length control protein FliK [Desulfonatronum lacustre]|uniref:flagellar hook-length control protein FliK n=1 Tax=Desulfonatronum lacustre TaxID=66849 RepID=UPI00048D083C|nr:flagellar hook-length control protein FliK [Desulfonatronum lacustre]
MQIFPSFSAQSGSSANTGFALDAPLFNLGNKNFEDVFGAFLRDTRDDAPFHPSPETTRSEHVRSDDRRNHPEPPKSVHQDLPRSRELDVPVNREDFAELRPKLEELGVDEETLDRLEDLFDSNETVTWRQVLDVLREPLKELANIKLTPEQEKDLISLLEKIGFSPDDALALAGDILDNKLDAVFKRIEELLSNLTGEEKFSFTSAEILALLQALGLMGGDKASGTTDPALGKFFGLSGESFGNVDPKSVQAMQAIAEAMRKAGIEMTAELRSVVHKALRENADLLQRVSDAAAKGELKLNSETLAAFQNALKQNAGGSSPNLDQILQQATEKELSPEELKKILGMIKEAAAGSDQDRNRLLAEIQRIMAASENRDLRMQAADNGPNAHRMSMTEAVNALKTVSSGGDGKNSGMMDRNGQGTPWQNPNAQNAANQSAQGWESFWNKVSVQGSGEASGGLLKDAGTDPRSILGQTTAATNTEAAARKVLANAPAPHRAVLNQVHSGLLQNMGQGRQQLTLQLHPADLGSLTVNLRVVGKEVQAVLRAENQEARQIIAENMPLLRQSLESQGLRVTRLEVSTQLQDQNQFTQLWQGSDGQKFQEQGANTQWAALGRGLQKNDAGGQDASEQASILLNSPREGGINLIA